MERECFFCGYCRQTDGSRTVAVTIEDGTVTEVDCCYGSCLYETTCPIGKAIAQAIKE